MTTLITVVVRVLETLFVVGMAGSAVVIVLSGIEDVETMLDMGDDEAH